MLGAQRVSAPPALHQRLLRGPALLGRAAGAELRGRGGLRGELAALHWLVRNKTSSALQCSANIFICRADAWKRERGVDYIHPPLHMWLGTTYWGYTSMGAASTFSIVMFFTC